ncbi:MAG: alpha/beta fold hydrolase [Burkholderiales bacterium]
MTSAKPDIKHETWEGVPVHVSRAPGKPLIFLIRMIAWETGIWDPVWTHLAGRFTVVNFNFFDSAAARQMANPVEGFARFARHCIDIAQWLGYERFHLVGWVGGTQVAMRCAIDFPERVESCTLLNPHFELPDMRSVQMGGRFKQAILEKDQELYSYYWVMSGLSNAFVESHFDVVKDLVDRRMAADRYVTGGTEQFAQWAKALRTKCVSDAELGAIKVPTLVVAGDLERWNAGPGPAMARLLHARIQGAAFELIPNTGELVLVEAPEKFLAALDRFLKGLA